ncbi:MAG: protein kinase [bacterium]|nr:protein kinase [bacterium]
MRPRGGVLAPSEKRHRKTIPVRGGPCPRRCRSVRPGGRSPRPELVEEWCARFPELADPERLARLIGEEFHARSSYGDRPTPQSCAERFPDVSVDGVDLAAWLSGAVTLDPVHAVGREIAHYRLEEEVGRGSFANVYRAHDTKLDRVVAVKVLRPDLLADEHIRARFHREVRMAAGPRHPGIVSVFEVGENAGIPYLVTEFIEGASLASRLERARPDPQSQRPGSRVSPRLCTTRTSAASFTGTSSRPTSSSARAAIPWWPTSASRSRRRPRRTSRARELCWAPQRTCRPSRRGARKGSIIGPTSTPSASFSIGCSRDGCPSRGRGTPSCGRSSRSSRNRRASSTPAYPWLWRRSA